MWPFLLFPAPNEQVMSMDDLIALPAAAQRLGMSWSRTWRRVLTGELEGEQRDGRWYVRREAVERELAEREAPDAA
jgi:hypothetical protein